MLLENIIRMEIIHDFGEALFKAFLISELLSNHLLASHRVNITFTIGVITRRL